MCRVVADFGNLEAMASGQVLLPASVRDRWGLRDGSVLDYLDLGGAVLILPQDVEGLLHNVSEAAAEADLGMPGDSSGCQPPVAGDLIRLSVGSDVWTVPWGQHDEFGTPAYWIDQTISGGYADSLAVMDPLTAIVYGLLHGSGVKAESGNAFLQPLMALLEQEPTAAADAVERVLRTPIEGVGRYRYPNKKAAFIAAAARQFHRESPPDDPRQLRRYLLDLRGVGRKTAALIITAVTGGHAAVHINDIWLRRALTPAGVFRREWDPEHDYDLFEEAFLQYARQGNVKPGPLDFCIWDLARDAGQSAFPELQH